MTIKIEFAGDQPSKREAKTYTGVASEWPDGVYQTKSRDAVIVVNGATVELAISKHGYVLRDYDWPCRWTRISDDPRIAAITFAGTMNYPDGKPDGVDEPDPIEAACDEIRRVCDEQFAKSQLSDPTDLKVGDWIQWECDNDPVQVWWVHTEDSFFRVADSEMTWKMDGHGYTVVPAPKESTSAD